MNGQFFAQLQQHSTSIRDCQWDSGTGRLVWLANRAGKIELHSAYPGEAVQIHTVDWAIRGQIGYGGGDFGVAAGQVVFVADGRLCIVNLQGGQPQTITPLMGRWAAPTLDATGKWVVAVWQNEGKDHLLICDTNNHFLPQRLTRHADFYMQPTFHPNGQWLAWIEWNNPDMPWSGSWLQLAQLDCLPAQLPRIRQMQTIAGMANHAVFQPCFSPDGKWLAYCSSESGWSEVYVRELATGVVQQLSHGVAEHDTPAWVQGLRTLAWQPDSQAILAIRNVRGVSSLWRYQLDGSASELVLPSQYTHLEQLSVHPQRGSMACIASGSQQPPRLLYQLSPQDSPAVQVYCTPEPLLMSRLQPPEAVSWYNHEGADQPCYGWLTRPNGSYPPKGVLLHLHGGPTSQVRACFQPDVQFYASLGWAVLQVNYRGSTGYGRDYQMALAGNWGEFDVQDTLGAARWLLQQGFSAQQIVLLGGSAGGLTALLAIAQAPTLFAAAITAYPVTDLLALQQQTHKFEAYYNDWLLGELPEAATRFLQRSPRYWLPQMQKPLLIFQGELDEVVPASQTAAFVQALRERKCPVDYICFIGEGHGWHKPETVQAYYQQIAAFLTRF
jgi:dipeptidyl aminopeptidase/acylaminoacyl peptidase